MSSEHHHNTHHHQQQELEKNAQEFLCKMWRGDGGRANDGSGSPKTSTSGRFLKTEGGEEELGVASNSSGQESEDLLVSKWLANMAGTTGKQAGNYAPLGINTTRPGTPPKIASMKHPHKDEEEESKKTCEGSPPSSPSSAGDSHDKKRCRMLRSTKSITLQELRLYFDKPIEEAAKAIGICSTLLKKICRRYNIKRWPYRQIKSLDRTIECLKGAAVSAPPSDQERFKKQIQVLESRRADLIHYSSLGSSHVGERSPNFDLGDSSGRFKSPLNSSGIFQGGDFCQSGNSVLPISTSSNSTGNYQDDFRPRPLGFLQQGYSNGLEALTAASTPYLHSRNPVELVNRTINNEQQGFRTTGSPFHTRTGPMETYHQPQPSSRNEGRPPNLPLPSDPGMSNLLLLLNERNFNGPMPENPGFQRPSTEQSIPWRRTEGEMGSVSSYYNSSCSYGLPFCHH